MAEIEKLFTTITTAEFAKAKQMARGRMQLRMEDTRAVAGWIGSQELLLDEIKTVDEIVERIDAVTQEVLN